MKVCITGATGFVGSYLLRRCVEQGDEVTILRRNQSPLRVLEGLPYREVIGDITDEKSVWKAVEGAQRVFHVAGLIGYWKKLRRLQHEVNVLGTRNVVRASLSCSVSRLVHTSSVVAVGYSEDGRPLHEDSDYNAEPLRLAYFDTKYQAELEILEGMRAGLNAVIVNPSVIFGPFALRPNSSEIVRRVMERKMPMIPPGGINAVGVEDVVQGHLLAAERGRSGERYILGGENLDYRELFFRIARLAGVAPPRRSLPRPLFSLLSHGISTLDLLCSFSPPWTPELFRMMPLYFYYSSDKAYQELGYRPRPLDETLHATIRFLKEQKFTR